MSKPGKNSNKINTNKKKKIEQSANKKKQNLNQNKKLSKLENKALLPTKNRASQQKRELQKDSIIERSTGRKEKFETNRLAQTSTRSGIPFIMTRYS